jgi:hypothetical protein
MRAGWRRWVGLILMAGLAGVMAGCTPTYMSRKISEPFVAQDAAFSQKRGRALVRGKAFFQESSGRVLKAVGEDIHLIPQTPYAERYIAVEFGKRKRRYFTRHVDVDPQFLETWRTTISQTSGSFEFKNVPDGDYYVLATVLSPREYGHSHIKLYQEVAVRGGEADYVSVRGH